MTAANRTIWAIVWSHGDSSGGGILRAYSNEETARRDMTMMEPISHAVLSVVAVPMLDEDSDDV